MGPHELTDVRPHAEQYALPLVLARTVLVWAPEVACDDRTVDSAHDLSQRDLLRWARQHVPPSYAALGTNEPGTLEREKDLFEIRLWKARPLGDVAYGGGALLSGVEREREKRSACVVPARRHSHDPMLPAVDPPGAMEPSCA